MHFLQSELPIGPRLEPKNCSVKKNRTKELQCELNHYKECLVFGIFGMLGLSQTFLHIARKYCLVVQLRLRSIG